MWLRLQGEREPDPQFASTVSGLPGKLDQKTRHDGGSSPVPVDPCGHDRSSTELACPGGDPEPSQHSSDRPGGERSEAAALAVCFPSRRHRVAFRSARALKIRCSISFPPLADRYGPESCGHWRNLCQPIRLAAQPFDGPLQPTPAGSAAVPLLKENGWRQLGRFENKHRSRQHS